MLFLAKLLKISSLSRLCRRVDVREQCGSEGNFAVPVCYSETLNNSVSVLVGTLVKQVQTFDIGLL